MTTKTVIGKVFERHVLTPTLFSYLKHLELKFEILIFVPLFEKKKGNN